MDTDNTQSLEENTSDGKVDTASQDGVSQQNSNPEAGADEAGWSWGAFVLDVPFLLATQNYAYFLIFALAIVPFVNLVFPIIYLGFKVFLGLKGRGMAQNGVFQSAQERAGFMRGIDWAGKVMFYAALIIFALGLLSMLLLGSEVVNSIPGA